MSCSVGRRCTRIPCCCGSGTGQGYGSNWTPSLGISICRESSPRNGKKTKKKTQKTTTSYLIQNHWNPKSKKGDLSKQLGELDTQHFGHWSQHFVPGVSTIRGSESTFMISDKSYPLSGLYSLICKIRHWTTSLSLGLEKFTKKFQYRLSLRLKQ